MSVLKSRRRPRKNQASMAASGLFRANFQSGHDKFSALLGDLNKLAGLLNLEPSLAPFHVPKYIGDNL